jgi:hypothetical protein
MDFNAEFFVFFFRAMSQSETEQVETSRLDVQSGAQTPKMGNVTPMSENCLQCWHFPEWNNKTTYPLVVCYIAIENGHLVR